MDFREKLTTSLAKNDTLFMAVFGALWGLTESTLGTFLHLVRFPFSGLLLGQVGLFILLNASRIHYRRGNLLLMAMISAFIKAVAISTVKLGPVVGIISEALVIESVIMRMGHSRISFMTSGLLVSLLPVLISLTNKTITFGLTFVEYLVDFVNSLSRVFHFPAGWYLVVLYFLLHFSVGIFSGWFTWRVSSDIQQRLSET